jgi:hypothetical protein
MRRNPREHDEFDQHLPETVEERLARRWKERDRQKRELTPAQKILLLGSAFSPRSIAGLQLWLDAGLSNKWQDSARTTPAVANADPVGAWDDLSGKGFHATQVTDSQRATLTIPGIGGVSTLAFATDDYLTLSTLLGKPANYTIFAVASVDSITPAECICGSVHSGGANRYSWGGVFSSYIGAEAGSDDYSFGNGTVNSIGRTTDSNVWVNTVGRISTHRYTSGQTAEEIWDGLTAKAISPTSSSASACSGTAYEFAIGRFGALASLFLTGKASALLVYNVALSDANRILVTNYLKKRFGL